MSTCWLAKAMGSTGSDNVRSASRWGGRTFFVASIDDLIAMKQRAGRSQDELDIAELRNIQKRLG